MKFNIFPVLCLVLALLGCRNTHSPTETAVPTVTGVMVNPQDGSVAKGWKEQFNAIVTGTNNPAQTVTWSVAGGGAGTGIDANGLLTVSAAETASTLTVTATSTIDTEKSGMASVTVITPAVNSVIVSPSTAKVYKGRTQQFIATVSVDGDLARTVTWSVTGAGTGTDIDDDGLLTVDADETAITLTVTATSTEDNTKSDTATVTVETLSPLTGAVVIKGTARNGYALTADTDNLFGNGTISYQWKRADTASSPGTEITGANDQSYGLMSADVNKYISVSVTRSENTGARTSEALGPVLATSGTTYTVSGTVTLNNGIEVVTVSLANADNFTLPTSGTVTITVSGSYQAYQWYVDGVALVDEPFGSLVLSGADYTSGKHRILVIVYRNGVPYSQEIRFTVG